MELPKIRDAMTKSVISCEMDCSIEEVAKLMAEKDIRSVIIKNKIGTPIGLLTGGDIVKAMAKKLGPKTLVEEIASKELITADIGADVIDAAKIMDEKNIKRLAIMEKGKLVGILTVDDVLKYLPKYLHEFSKTFDALDAIIKKL